MSFTNPDPNEYFHPLKTVDRDLKHAVYKKVLKRMLLLELAGIIFFVFAYVNRNGPHGGSSLSSKGVPLAGLTGAFLIVYGFWNVISIRFQATKLLQEQMLFQNPGLAKKYPRPKPPLYFDDSVRWRKTVIVSVIIGLLAAVTMLIIIYAYGKL